MKNNFRAMVVKVDNGEQIVALHPSNFPRTMTDLAKLLYDDGTWKVVRLTKEQFISVIVHGISKFEKGTFFNETK